MWCITLSISSNPFNKPRRVLNFGKYRGFTINGVISHEKTYGKSGYLQWCLANVKGFKEELNDDELKISQSDKYVPKIGGNCGEYEGYGWLAPEDCDLLCM